MSRTIPHRELRNNSSAILRDVSQGETFQITNNGVVVALLVPPNTITRPSLRVRKALTKGGFDGLVRPNSIIRFRKRSMTFEVIGDCLHRSVRGGEAAGVGVRIHGLGHPVES